MEQVEKMHKISINFYKTSDSLQHCFTLITNWLVLSIFYTSFNYITAVSIIGESSILHAENHWLAESHWQTLSYYVDLNIFHSQIYTIGLNTSLTTYLKFSPVPYKHSSDSEHDR